MNVLRKRGRAALLAAGLGFSALAAGAADGPPDSFVTAGGIRFVRIPAGSFTMGKTPATDPTTLRQSPVLAQEWDGNGCLIVEHVFTYGTMQE
jgi:hypothetical protein